MTEATYPVPLDAGVARIVTWLDSGRREAFEERAGIMEHDAKLLRLEAERLALIQTLAHYGLPTIAHLLRLRHGNLVRWVLTTDVEAARRALQLMRATDVVEERLDTGLPPVFRDVAWLAHFP